VRDSTIKKLFESAPAPADGEPRYQIYWELHRKGMHSITCVHILASHEIALIQEFKDEADGFEVFIRTPGNSIQCAQHALGLMSDEAFRKYLREKE
jgi:hypothetical protein